MKKRVMSVVSLGAFLSCGAPTDLCAVTGTTFFTRPNPPVEGAVAVNARVECRSAVGIDISVCLQSREIGTTEWSPSQACNRVAHTSVTGFQIGTSQVTTGLPTREYRGVIDVRVNDFTKLPTTYSDVLAAP